MATKRKPYTPSMSDAAIEGRTGKNWRSWFQLLDKAGAHKLGHKEIAARLAVKHKVPGWWAQMLTVEYERARGLRAKHETASGYSVAVSKTVGASLSKLYAATANDTQRKRWFPRGRFAVSSQTKDKYFRGSWGQGVRQGARLEMGFYAKGEGKAQIAIQIGKLAKPADVEAQRRASKAALTRLQALLEA
jgi:hypothetical protein